MFLSLLVITLVFLIYDLSISPNIRRTSISNIYSVIFYIFIACIFGVWISYYISIEKSYEYFTCYFVEKAMSLDNIFVIYIIFEFFSIPLEYQNKILCYGILGILFFRAIMLYFGILIMSKMGWFLYVFALILIITGIKILYMSKDTFKVQDSFVYRVLAKYLHMSEKMCGGSFFFKDNNITYVTPIFTAFVMILSMDVLFAFDSVPAIFSITNDVFIICTSNLFAVLGLKSLFFCLVTIIERFSYLKYSLGIILIFIGIKIFISYFYTVSVISSLIITLIILLCGIVFSFYQKPYKN